MQILDKNIELLKLRAPLRGLREHNTKVLIITVPENELSRRVFVYESDHKASFGMQHTLHESRFYYSDWELEQISEAEVTGILLTMKF